MERIGAWKVSLLALALVAKGFTKVTVLDEGLGVWRAKKYGTNLGKDAQGQDVALAAAPVA